MHSEPNITWMKHITVFLHGSKTVKPFVPCCGSLSNSEIRYGKPNTSTPSTRYDSCEWYVRAATSLSFSFILSLSLSLSLTHTFYPTSFMTSFIFPLILVTFTQDSGLWLSGRLATLLPVIWIQLSLFLSLVLSLQCVETSWDVFLTMYNDLFPLCWWPTLVMTVCLSVNMLFSTAVEKLKEATLITHLHTLAS